GAGAAPQVQNPIEGQSILRLFVLAGVIAPRIEFLEVQAFELEAAIAGAQQEVELVEEPEDHDARRRLEAQRLSDQSERGRHRRSAPETDAAARRRAPFAAPGLR